MIIFVYEILYFNIMFNKKKNNILFIKIKYCFFFTNTHKGEGKSTSQTPLKIHSKRVCCVLYNLLHIPLKVTMAF